MYYTVHVKKINTHTTIGNIENAWHNRERKNFANEIWKIKKKTKHDMWYDASWMEM